MIIFLDEFLYEMDKFKNLDEDVFLDVTLENPIDIEFAKTLDEKKKMFNELRNKLGSTEDETKILIIGHYFFQTNFDRDYSLYFRRN